MGEGRRRGGRGREGRRGSGDRELERGNGGREVEVEGREGRYRRGGGTGG